MKTPRSRCRRSTCTHGVATNRPQPPVPSSIATGLRDPYMSLCQRGSIVSSAPRRSNCTGCSRHGRSLLRPRTAFAHAEHRVLVELERQRAVRLEHELLHQLTGGVLDDDGQRVRRDLDAEAPDSPSNRFLQLSHTDSGRRIRLVDDGGMSGKFAGEAERLERDAKAVFAGGSNVELRGLSSRRDRLGARDVAHR